MGSFILSFVIGTLKTDMVKTLIALGVRKLLEVKGDGITKDIAEVMIDGIAKSKQNPTTEEAFKDALNILNKE